MLERNMLLVMAVDIAIYNRHRDRDGDKQASCRHRQRRQIPLRGRTQLHHHQVHRHWLPNLDEDDDNEAL